MCGFSVDHCGEIFEPGVMECWPLGSRLFGVGRRQLRQFWREVRAGFRLGGRLRDGDPYGFPVAGCGVVVAVKPCRQMPVR